MIIILIWHFCAVNFKIKFEIYKKQIMKLGIKVVGDDKPSSSAKIKTTEDKEKKVIKPVEKPVKAEKVSTSAKATVDKSAIQEIKDSVAEKIASKKGEARKEGEYTAKDIYVLKGLEPVRMRPGMYIGSTGLDGLHHLIWEVVDNCLDEAMAGYAKNITVSLLPNDRVRVSDDGRGIPVEKHPDTGKSTLETVLTTLHAGGKFGGEAYKVSGGLHGVGISVVCALSDWMESEIHRDGGVYKQEYVRGVPKAPVKKVGEAKDTGTIQTFEADPQIFKEIKYDPKRILNHLRQQCYLTKGVKITFKDERVKGEETSYTFYLEAIRQEIQIFFQLQRKKTELQLKLLFSTHKKWNV